MPMIICDNGHVSSYRNTRGSRIAEMRCECGGTYHRAEYEDGQWVRRRPASKRLGAMVTCPVCDKRRRSEGSAVKRAEETSVAISLGGRRLVTVLAGTVVCWNHELIPAVAFSGCGRARPPGDYVDRPVCNVVAAWEGRALLRYPQGWHVWHDVNLIERVTDNT